MRQLELLAPARDLQIGIAAIDCGADAVYIAGPQFGARQAAGNEIDDIRQLCAYAHKFGARIFITLNTILYDSELEAAYRFMLDVQEAGADAIIIQDMAVVAMAEKGFGNIKEEIRIPLHASTQCAIRTPEHARFLESLGFSRLILERQLSLEEIKAIKEFVIAIDTSGSTSGELVQKFVQKTYNILKSAESFFTKINLHIIQCDAEIQEDRKITCQEDFDEYLKTMQIRGLGGTDFRPVFEYVEQLRKKKEFTNLKGLIYFTDGYGAFPAKKPDYDTAFVFIDEEYNNPDVPPWAIRLILQKDEI